MGAIEDPRRVLQDFLAPELRAISVRLDALENRLDGVDRRLDKAEDRAEKRHGELMGEMRKLFDLNSIQERLTRLESRHEMHQ